MSQPELTKLAKKQAWFAGKALIAWNRVGLEENWVGFDDRLPAFARDPGSPRTDVLGNFQPSLRDWSGCGRKPSTACWAIFSRPFGTDPDTP